MSSRLVYSTDQGRICPQCQQPQAACRCKPGTKAAAPAEANKLNDGIVRLHRQTKGRGGKGVTLITGLTLADEALKALASELKKQCGTGGAVKDGIIEIQGDQRALLKPLLEKKGHQVKIAGA